MTIKFKRNGKDVIYAEEELLTFSREKIKTIKGEIQSNIEWISAKKESYNADNDDGYGSKEYFSKIAQYKSINAKLRNYITYLNSILETKQESQLKQNEHWLWCFYMNVKSSTRKGKFNKLVELTDERAKYHVEIGE